LEKLLSIIIPIYNVRKYLQSCLNSFSSAAEDNRVEILLVDDGSTDGSGILADELVKAMPNARVFHKENGGLSDARNYGSERASGKYIMYVDSDDEVNASVLAKVIEELSISGYDALVWDTVRIDENGKPLPSRPDDAYFRHGGLVGGTVYNFEDFVVRQIKDHGDFLSIACMAAFKRSVIDDSGLLFEKGLLHEDELWVPRMLSKCGSIFYSGVELYLYRERENSITSCTSNREKRLKDLIYIFRQQYAYFSLSTDTTALEKTLRGIISKRFLHNLAAFEYELIRENLSYPDRWQIFVNSRRTADRLRSLVLLVNIRLFLFGTKKLRGQK